MKRCVFGCLFVLLAVALTAGCTYGSYSVISAVENNTATSLSMTYDKFNGYKAAKVTVKDHETIEVKVDIATDEGDLGLSITDEHGSSFYQGSKIPTSSFTVILDKAGKYEIKVTGKNHTGSYDISWGKAE